MKNVYDISPDDFKNNVYGGFDLRTALRNEMTDNVSNQAENFLLLVIKHLMRWVDKNSFRNYRWERLSPRQLDMWRDAVCAQAHYTYREGLKAVGMFAGADDERGKIMDANYIASITVCEACLDILTDAGIFNLTIKNRRKTWPAGGNYGFF